MPNKKPVNAKVKKTVVCHITAQQKTMTYSVTRKLSTGTSVSFSKKAPCYIVEGRHLISYGK